MSLKKSPNSAVNPILPKDIGKAYDSITHLWEDKKFNLQNGIAQHQKAIAFTGNRGPALDVGCGATGRFIGLLIENGFTPEGIDVSKKMLKLAKKKHPDITFYHEDVCQWQPPKQYDFISAWDSIWHVPLNQHAKLIKTLLKHLTPNGVCLFSCGGLDEASDHCDDTMGPMVYYSSLGIQGFLDVIQQSNCTLRHMEFDQYPELHCYFIVQKRS